MRNRIPPPGTLRGRDPVPLRVQEASDLRQVAVTLDEVVEHGGLAEKCVTAVQDSLHPLLVGVDEGVRGVALHVAPHFLVPLDFGISVANKKLISVQFRAVKY